MWKVDKHSPVNDFHSLPVRTRPIATVATLPGIEQLRKSLSPGAQALTPDSAGYDARRLLLNRRFDYRPAVIVAVANEADVSLAVRFARQQNLRIAIRAGGCSPAGFSSNDGGMQLDLSGLNSIEIDSKAMTVQVGAGVILQHLVEAIGPSNLMTPVGECLPVGLTGLALGGGFGMISRSAGLTCDNIVEARVVTAPGVAVTASARINPDLYWALRGAGGGNFGVVTSLTMRLHRVPPAMAMATFMWPADQAVEVLKTLLPYFASEAPDELNAVFSMLPMKGAGRVIGGMAMYNGEPGKAQPFLSRITGVGKPLMAKVVTAPYYKRLLEIPNQAADIHDYYKSGFVTGVLPEAGIEAVVEGFLRARELAPSIMNMVAFELAGGAINRVAPADTAFVHRTHTLLLSIVASWTGKPGVPDSPEQGWADGVYRQVLPYLSGEVYQNYPDLGLADPQKAYFGANLERLRRIKRSIDPENVFRFAQGITPA